MPRFSRLWPSKIFMVSLFFAASLSYQSASSQTYSHNENATMASLTNRADRSNQTSIPFIWHRGVHAVGVAGSFGGDDSEVWLVDGIPIQENSFMSYRIFSWLDDIASSSYNIVYRFKKRPDYATPANFDCDRIDLLEADDFPCDILANIPSIVEADPRRTKDGIWYAHHDAFVDRTKDVSVWKKTRSTKLSEMTSAEFNKLQTIYWNANGSGPAIECNNANVCDPVRMDRIFHEISKTTSTTVLALHMHSQQDLIDMAAHAWAYELKHNRPLMNRIFFLLPVSELGDKSASLKQLPALWGIVDQKVRAEMELVSKFNDSSKALPSIFVTVNLFDGAKDMKDPDRNATLTELSAQYPNVNGKTGGDNLVKFLGFGMTSGSTGEANRELQEIGRWVKAKGWHVIKATIHPDTTQPETNKFCFRDTDGKPGDAQSMWCPGAHRTRLMSWTMGLPMNTSSRGLPDIAGLASAYNVNPATGNGQVPATIVVSDRPTLDATFMDLGTTFDTTKSSRTNRY